MEKEICVRCGKETPYDQSITNLRCDAGMSKERGRCGQGKKREKLISEIEDVYGHIRFHYSRYE